MEHTPCAIHLQSLKSYSPQQTREILKHQLSVMDVFREMSFPAFNFCLKISCVFTLNTNKISFPLYFISKLIDLLMHKCLSVTANMWHTYQQVKSLSMISDHKYCLSGIKQCKFNSSNNNNKLQVIYVSNLAFLGSVHPTELRDLTKF